VRAAADQARRAAAELERLAGGEWQRELARAQAELARHQAGIESAQARIEASRHEIERAAEQLRRALEAEQVHELQRFEAERRRLEDAGRRDDGGGDEVRDRLLDLLESAPPTAR
jgi:hypothetical protein